jgi:hypothetical protein
VQRCADDDVVEAVAVHVQHRHGVAKVGAHLGSQCYDLEKRQFRHDILLYWSQS